MGKLSRSRQRSWQQPALRSKRFSTSLRWLAAQQDDDFLRGSNKRIGICFDNLYPTLGFDDMNECAEYIDGRLLVILVFDVVERPNGSLQFPIEAILYPLSQVQGHHVQDQLLNLWNSYVDYAKVDVIKEDGLDGAYRSLYILNHDQLNFCR